MARTIYFPGKLLKSSALSVPAQESSLHSIRDFVSSLCLQLKIPPHETHDLLLASDEAASNIYLHAYETGPGKIEVRAAVFRRYFRLEFVDHGRPFDWRGIPTPDLGKYVADQKKGGLGIWFIRKLTDASDYRTGAKGNVLTLWKHLPQVRARWKELVEGVAAFAEGRFDQRIPVRGRDEVALIARSFNDMAHKFSAVQRNLVEQEAMKKELQVAKTIQQGLLPAALPDLKGYEVGCVYRAAKDVGGDYFDFIPVDAKHLGVCVADVSGKGVPGSLVMTIVRTAMRLEASEILSPSKVLARVNRFISADMMKGMFVTLYYLVLDFSKREIRCACAGHPPMILYRAASGKTRPVKPGGFPLGIPLPDPGRFAKALGEEKIKLHAGDVLVVYSDGVIEAMDSDRRQFGLDRLMEAVRVNADLPASLLVERLQQAQSAFTANAPQHDDITLVALKVLKSRR